MRDEKEERKKQARSNKQTRQSNTAHPRQSLFLYMYMVMLLCQYLSPSPYIHVCLCTWYFQICDKIHKINLKCADFYYCSMLCYIVALTCCRGRFSSDGISFSLITSDHIDWTDPCAIIIIYMYIVTQFHNITHQRRSSYTVNGSANACFILSCSTTTFGCIKNTCTCTCS